MSLLERFNRTKTEITQMVARESRGASESMRLKNAISANEQKIKQLYMEIGETYYEARKEKPDPFAKSRVEAVTALLAENRESRKRISVLKGNVVCERCGFGNQQGAKYCSECGAELPEKIPEQVVVSQERSCPRCGAKAEEDMRFCMNCGAALVLQLEEDNRSAEDGSAGAPSGEQMEIGKELSEKKEESDLETEEEPAPETKEEIEKNILETDTADTADTTDTANTTDTADTTDTANTTDITDTINSTNTTNTKAQLDEQETTAEETTAANEEIDEAVGKCPFCGTAAEPGDVFCVNCGRRLKETRI